MGALGIIFFLTQSRDRTPTNQEPFVPITRVLPTAKEADRIIDDFLSADILEEKLSSIRFASVMRQSVVNYYAEIIDC